jgi:hypothetical protein
MLAAQNIKEMSIFVSVLWNLAVAKIFNIGEVRLSQD